MEEHMADLQRAQRGKKVLADARALELDALRPEQAQQGLPGKVSGTLVEGGMAGLKRVIGSGGSGAGMCGGKKPKCSSCKYVRCRCGGGVTGAGVVSDLGIPLISDVARLFGLGKKKQGRKAREDERLAMEVKGLKNKMKKMKRGGALIDPGLSGSGYVDPEFGVINQPQGTAQELERFATGGMRGGFLPLLAMAAAPLLGKLFGGMPKRYGKSQSYSDEELEALMEGMSFGAPGSPVRPLVRPVARSAAAAAAAPASAVAANDRAAVDIFGPVAAARASPASPMASASAAAPAPRKRGRPARGSPVAGIPMGRLSPSALQEAAASMGLLPEPRAAFRKVSKSPEPYMGTPPTRPSSVEEESGKMSGKKTSRSGEYKKGKGGAKACSRAASRQNVVREIMKKHKLSLPQASKYVKEHCIPY